MKKYVKLLLLLFIILTLLNGCGVRVNDEVLSQYPLSVSPTEKTVVTKPGGLFLTVRGGKAPYKFTILQGEGKINDGFFEAPEKPGLTLIEVEDKLHHKVIARINIIERK